MLGLAGFLCASASAFAQDADADGVSDAADAFPCDATRASVSYFPGQSTSALLAFEDQWPGHTDIDFNDVAVRVHYRLERNAAGNVVQLHAVIDPVAQGGDLSSGLGLQLPVPRTGVTVRRRVGGGAWQGVSLEGDASATMVLSPNLRELFGGATGRINSVANQARLSGQRLEVEVSFSPAASLSAAAAPFDTFAFRAGNLSHQIHFPQYAGTAAMNAALFNTDQDASTGTRRFVHVSGVPAALNLMTSTRYPLEGVGISALFPDIAGFAASGGALNTAFYASNVVSAQGHDVAAPALPAVAAPSGACLRPFHRFALETAGGYVNSPSMQGDVMVLRSANAAHPSNYQTGVGAIGIPAEVRTGYLQFGVATCSPDGSRLGLGVQNGSGDINSLAQELGPIASTWGWYRSVAVQETQARTTNYLYIPGGPVREVRVRYMVLGHPDDVAHFMVNHPVSGPCL
jgi:LruC domain-containing protein